MRATFVGKAVDVTVAEVRDILLTRQEETDTLARFARIAPTLSSTPGFAVDLLTGWDHEDEDQVEELDRMMKEEDSYLLIGSTPCTVFSLLLHIPRPHRNPEELEAQRDRRRHQLELACRYIIERMRRREKRHILKMTARCVDGP